MVLYTEDNMHTHSDGNGSRVLYLGEKRGFNTHIFYEPNDGYFYEVEFTIGDHGVKSRFFPSFNECLNAVNNWINTGIFLTQ